MYFGWINLSVKLPFVDVRTVLGVANSSIAALTPVLPLDFGFCFPSRVASGVRRLSVSLHHDIESYVDRIRFMRQHPRCVPCGYRHQDVHGGWILGICMHGEQA